MERDILILPAAIYWGGKEKIFKNFLSGIVDAAHIASFRVQQV